MAGTVTRDSLNKDNRNKGIVDKGNMQWTNPFTLMDRYLLKQIVDYFLLGMVIFTLIAFFSDTFIDFLRDIQKFGIPVSTALAMIGLQMPKTVFFILPASAFLAVLMVFHNLNGQFEIISMRASGISLNRLLIPALLIGLCASTMAYVLGDYIVPFCNQEAALLKEQALKNGSLPYGTESFTFKNFDKDHNLKHLIYVSSYQDQKLGNSTIIDLTRPGVMQIIQSKSGKWHPDHWQFNDANAYTIFKNSNVLAFHNSEKLNITNLLSGDKDETKKEEKDSNKQLSDAKLSIDSDTQNFATLLYRIQAREVAGRPVPNGTYINLWEKITLPLSCMVMLLVAVPLALSAPRAGSNVGFVMALAVLFLYYVLRSFFVAMGRAGSLTLGDTIPMEISLLLAAWLPLIAIGVIGMLLITRKSRVL